MPSRVSNYIQTSRRVAGAVRRRIGQLSDGSAVAQPSPYELWHGPPATAAASTQLMCTKVADIALLQGCAPAEAILAIELNTETEPIPVVHRFPHPHTPVGPSRAFEITLDHDRTSDATEVRLVVDGAPQRWISLPTLPAPGAITGTENLSNCPTCGAPDPVPAGRRQHLTMATCQQCGLLMTTPRPVEDQTLVRYSERYFDDEYLPSQQLTPSLTRHIDSILDHAEPAKALSPTLFELGVGGGNLSARAIERGWQVRGTDVNPASIAHASERGIDAWHENADHATSLDGEYGAVISEMSLEHVRHPEHFVELAADALVPGGRLVIYTVSAEGDSFEHAGMASPLVGPAEHLFLYSAGSLVAMCERASLRVDTLWRSATGDEIGVVAVKRRDVENPALPRR